ncbi:hypothetical protein BYT27DRAFT_7210896 [Phlegmacium glaucopus]|nr:hypothetical protein BYT27DRAFT_7210896 [Phlegmacium glaucopus]
MCHRIAEDKWYRRFSQATREHYHKMGLLSISVVVYTRKNGQTAIEIHDNIASTLGVYLKSFEDINEAKVTEIKWTLLEYIKSFQGLKSGPTGTGTGLASGQETLTIQVDDDGFPIFPCQSSWDKIPKDDLERLYRLASRDKDCQAPFGRLALKQSDFIRAKYLPRGISLSDPQSMKHEAMIQFFEHIAAWQTTHGIQDAFRFKTILYSRKKGFLREARYMDMNADEPAPALKKKTQRKPQTKTWTAADSRVINLEQVIQDAPYSFNTIGSVIPTVLQDPLNLQSVEPSALPSLTLDLAYNVDPPVNLDPSLEPGLDENMLFTMLLMDALPPSNVVPPPAPALIAQPRAFELAPAFDPGHHLWGYPAPSQSADPLAPASQVARAFDPAAFDLAPACGLEATSELALDCDSAPACDPGNLWEMM